MLQEVQQLLLNFGIFSRIYRDRKPGKRTAQMPDGRGGSKEYTVRPFHEIHVSSGSMVRFAAHVGFLTARKQAAVEAAVSSYTRGPYPEKFVARVENSFSDGIEPVFDLIEPDTHSLIANGVVIHNMSLIHISEPTRPY